MFWRESRTVTEDLFDYKFRVIVVGDSGVGKTSILQRFKDGFFYETFGSSRFLELNIKRIEVDDKLIRLDIWDTMGQERFRSLGAGYFRRAQGVLLVYDLTKMDSFLNVDKWFNDVEFHTLGSVQVLLIGNKSDLEEARVVQCRQGKELADTYGVPFLETSAKNDTNVEQAFILLATMLKNRPDVTSQSANIVDTTSAVNRGATCC